MPIKECLNIMQKQYQIEMLGDFCGVGMDRLGGADA